jgi:hypothetical protein
MVTASAAAFASAAKILESAEGSLAGMLVHALICGTAVCWFHSCVAAIAGQNAQYQAAALAASLSKNNTQLELEEDSSDDPMMTTNGDYVRAGGHDDQSDPSSPNNNKNHNQTPPQQSGDSPTSTKHHHHNNNNNDDHSSYRLGKLSKEDMIALTVKLWILLLLNYLLLVYLPGGVILSFIAMAAIWGLTLHGYLSEELFRRRRLDRAALLLALFCAIAMSLTAFTYHRITFQQGDVYQGAARIVGYDTSVYNNSDGESLRTNLEVNWGGSWACPGSPTGTQCQAVVQGALCQTKYDVEDYDRRRRSRVLKNNTNSNSTSSSSGGSTMTVTAGKEEANLTLASDDTVAGEEEVFADTVVEIANEEVDEVIDEANEEVTEIVDGT